MIAICFVKAQNASTLIGSKAMGLGYTSSCLADAWSVFNNSAGLAKVEHPTAGFTYEAHPSFKTFNRMATVFALPAGPGVAALGVYRFGDDIYNEQILSAAFANTLGLASLGLKLNYLQYHAEGFGNARALTINFGGIAQLTPQLSVGAHILNINQPKITEQADEILPTLLTIGLGFKPSDKIFVTSELEKDLSHDLTWKTGIEYKFHEKVAFRTGFNYYPQAGFFGLGWKAKKFHLDYALAYRLNLGAAHQASVSYRFQQKQK